MTSARHAREVPSVLRSGLSPLHPPGHPPALLEAIRTMQEAADLKTVAEHAAAGVLQLTDAVAATAYVVTASGERVFATAGQISLEMTEKRAAALMKLAAAGGPQAAPLAGEAGTLAAAFQAETVRGAVVAEGNGLLFSDEDARVAADFAAQVGVSASAVVVAERLRLLQRMDAAVVESVCEGVLAVNDRRITLLNGAGARLLAMNPADAIWRPVEAFWPALARAMESGKPLDGEPMKLRGKPFVVTLRSFPEGPWATCAVATFTEPPRAASRPHAAGSTFSTLVGVSRAIGLVREVAEVAARSASGVLIEGESGVGKEVLAQAIHANGPRRQRPFVAVLCAAIPRELLESELFGYEAGSFTGASPRGRAGKFELANGGTLLLDDIVDMPLEMQAKLLRVLQEHTVTRLGGSRPHPVDVRIIATANRNVSEAVRAGLFRADLYYRINVLSIGIPPLAQRREDIKPLAEHFLRKHAPAHHSNLMTVGEDALRALQQYPWPGNVRELEHWIESEIHFAPPRETCLRKLTRQPAAGPRQTRPPRSLRDVERELFATAMVDAAGDISRAARDLGISRGKLYRKLRIYELLPK
ncbi:MAG TPA: sigma 54-interacting transcriptional regulator [Myxococcales bacterium]